jgi:hypothetical protein
MRGSSSAHPEAPWVMTLFAPPVLRVNGEEYRQVLRDATLRQQLPPLYVVVPLKTSSRSLAARILACRRAWARRGWRPCDRSERFGWSTGDITVIKQPMEDEP